MVLQINTQSLTLLSQTVDSTQAAGPEPPSRPLSLKRRPLGELLAEFHEASAPNGAPPLSEAVEAAKIAPESPVKPSRRRANGQSSKNARRKFSKS